MPPKIGNGSDSTAVDETKGVSRAAAIRFPMEIADTLAVFVEDQEPCLAVAVRMGGEGVELAFNASVDGQDAQEVARLLAALRDAHSELVDGLAAKLRMPRAQLESLVARVQG